ncbi:conserved hypothetical protein [Leishmania infantum JPCM5]|uniref:RNA_recognition_motif._(A.k.a._RRM_-_RBD_-_or_RNP_domain)_-_putative n=3 Tax=Leishmania donovani species complex TaxID=38574 RepID=A0A6L0XPB9_LEIIN|nr:conserved hypothetical protein [Leishmania infantum JPCM5]CAC9532019.1 RNA_recognition_motif._(a.k.a._RRM_-_RBD_-_or_RNP_domain)_-_putative [Leishmania infantum]CAM71316.1 conserved hypothetical protein [Leishmania infantum JPCM5]SUZ45159.1 RNA_recognition_motif._(a.k.a._RRM_-_RBD_-_or_RNP_domain)_-_putative [Leishmania infantum]|eukprot:XP_001468235.1 conserved hypothetical protein [Leishmania infantum JPCM5]
MYNFFTGVNAPSTPPQKQPQAEPSLPPSACHHHVAASSLLDGMTTHSASLWLLNAAQHPPLSYARSDGGGGNLAGAEQEKWTTASNFYSTFPTSAAPPSSSGVQSLHGVGQQPAQQPHQHLCTSILQSHEHVGSSATPVPGLSSRLPLQEHLSSTCVTLRGESLRVRFDGAPYSPFASTNVSTASQPPEAMHSNQQYYDSMSHHRRYSASSASSIRHTLQVSASPEQQHQQQRLPISSSAWAAATPATATPASLFASSFIRSLASTTYPWYSCDLSGNALPTLPAAVPAPYVSGTTLPMSSQSQATYSVMPQPPKSGQPCSSTAHPTLHSIMIVHPTLDRGTAAILQASTDAVNTPLHCLTDLKASEISGTTHYLEAVQGGGSVGDNSKQSYPSSIPTASRQPQPPLQQYCLQPTSQQQQSQQLAAEQSPVYSCLLTNDGNISHFVSHTTVAGAIIQPPSSMLNGVASLASLNSGAAGAGRSGAWQQPSTADMGSYNDQSSKLQLQQQQQQQLRPVSAARPVTDTRGIARRNRDRAVLFVGQLNYEATEADVSQVFSCYGKPLSVVVLKDKGKAAKKGGAGGISGGSATTHRKVGGSAFVTYGTTLEADTAIVALHGRYNAKDDDAENVDNSKYLQVSYGQQTGLISAFGMMHAEKLHASKPENPIPLLVKGRTNGKS